MLNTIKDILKNFFNPEFIDKEKVDSMESLQEVKEFINSIEIVEDGAYIKEVDQYFYDSGEAFKTYEENLIDEGFNYKRIISELEELEVQEIDFLIYDYDLYQRLDKQELEQFKFIKEGINKL